MKQCATCSELYPDEAAFCPSDGRELQRTKDPHLGRTLAARYRLIKRLGSGGMSVVYLARHVMIERLSAIKILRQDLGMSPTHRERFLREARAVNRINHRNIVEITDFGESDGLVYLVMEYVDGESLMAHLRRNGGPLPWARAVRVAQQVASALARAHQMGVIHRDLKPENVMLLAGAGESDDLVKLTDFGIAKIVDAPALTFSEQMFGTPGYIAPEYVEGLACDGRADIYSLGVVLYESITGKLPFDTRSQADLLMLPLSSAPIPPSVRRDGLALPADLESLVLRMLARRREDRPRDAFAVHDALADVLRRFGPTGSRRPPPQSQAPASKRSASGAPADRESRPPLVAGVPRPSAVPSMANEERLTAEVAKVPTMQISSRWLGAIGEVDEAIARARARGGRDAAGAARASELAESARKMVANVERAAAMVGEHQSRVDRLEARGREFRGNLGFAVDQLVRERSREAAHAEALATRCAALRETSPDDGPSSRERATDTATDSATDSAGARSGDARMWELAALEAENERAREIDRDLGFQIEALQKKLDQENEAIDLEMAVASGALEGSLSALRLLTSELVKTLDEAAKAVTARA